MSRPPSKTHNSPTTFEQSTSADEYVQRKINQIYDQGAFRNKTNEIIGEYVDTVPFMEKVQKYADQQIDARLFKNATVVAGVIIGWFVTLAISYFVAKFAK